MEPLDIDLASLLLPPTERRLNAIQLLSKLGFEIRVISYLPRRYTKHLLADLGFLPHLDDILWSGSPNIPPNHPILHDLRVLGPAAYTRNPAVLTQALHSFRTPCKEDAMPGGGPRNPGKDTTPLDHRVNGKPVGGTKK